MPRPTGKTKAEPISTDELRKLIEDSGLTVGNIERSVKMPSDTLRKSLAAKPDANGYIRTVPTKWLPKILAYLRAKKIEKVELKEVIEETLKEHNIPVVVAKVEIPDEQRKLDWIAKLQEVKAKVS